MWQYKIYYAVPPAEFKWLYYPHPDSSVVAATLPNLTLPRYYHLAIFYLTAVDSSRNESLPSTTITNVFCQQDGKLYGDYTEDGFVDVLDYGWCRHHLGSVEGSNFFREQLDLDGDGLVDIMDDYLMQSNLGERQ